MAIHSWGQPLKLPPLYCSKVSGTQTDWPSPWPTSGVMEDIFMCALCFTALSTLKVAAGGEIGSEWRPGPCTVSRAELGLTLRSLGAPACHRPQGKDMGMGRRGTNL